MGFWVVLRFLLFGLGCGAEGLCRLGFPHELQREAKRTAFRRGSEISLRLSSGCPSLYSSTGASVSCRQLTV